MTAFKFSDPRLVEGSPRLISNSPVALVAGSLVDRKGYEVDPTDSAQQVYGILLEPVSIGDTQIIAPTGARIRVTEGVQPLRTYVNVGTGTYDLEENLPVGQYYKAVLLAEDTSHLRLRVYNVAIAKVDAAPVVSISSSEITPTNVSPIPITISFSAEVSGFVQGDVSVTGGTISNFSTSNNTVWTFDLTPSGEGSLTVNVAAGVATGVVSGQTNSAAPEFEIEYDNTNPTVTLSVVDNPTTETTFTVTAAFDEDVQGVTLNRFSTDSGTLGNLVTVDAQNYTFDVQGASLGLVRIDCPTAGGITDLAGNTNDAATQLAVTVAQQPTVVVSTSESDPNNEDPMEFDVVFSEAVSGFVAGDLTVTNGSASNLQTADNISFTVDIAPTADGAVSVQVPAGVATSSASSLPNVESNVSSVESDSTSPTVSITTTESDPTGVSLIPLTIIFSEPVTGFEASDVTVNLGTIQDFTPNVDNSVFTMNLSTSSQGEHTVDVGGGVASDAAGNPNIAASQLSIDRDTTPPTVAITSTESSPTSADPIPLVVTFSKAVTGFTIDDITVSSGTLGNFQVVTTKDYTVELTPDADGALTVDIAADATQDTAGNGNTAAPTFNITFDGTAPVPTITSSETGLISTASVLPMTITFSEDVTGVAIGDLTVTNGTTSNWSAVSASVYTFDITPDGDGIVTAVYPADSAEDTAGGGNVESNTWQIVSDQSAPTVTFTSTESDPTYADPIPMTATADEEVTGFTADSLTIVGGTATNFQTSDNRVFTFDLNPTTPNTTLTVDLDADEIQDLAGNGNVASTQFEIESINPPATATITTEETSPTNDDPIAMTITFSEAMTGLVAGEFVVTNCTIDTLATADGGTTWTFNCNPTADGLVEVQLPADQAQDVNGTGNLESNNLQITSLTTGPTVTLSTNEPDPTDNGSFSIAMAVTAQMDDIVAGDFTVTGPGSITGFFRNDIIGGSALDYTMTVTFSGTDTAVTVQLPADSGTDAAGNGNLVSNTISVTRTLAGPTPTISSTASDPTATSPIPVTIDFGEAMNGFVLGDITVGNGTAGNFTDEGGGEYSVDITPSSEATVTVDVADAVATTVSGGDANKAATQFTIEYSTFEGVEIDGDDANWSDTSSGGGTKTTLSDSIGTNVWRVEEHSVGTQGEITYGGGLSLDGDQLYDIYVRAAGFRDTGSGAVSGNILTLGSTDITLKDLADESLNNGSYTWMGKSGFFQVQSYQQLSASTALKFKSAAPPVVDEGFYVDGFVLDGRQGKNGFTFVPGNESQNWTTVTGTDSYAEETGALCQPEAGTFEGNGNVYDGNTSITLPAGTYRVFVRVKDHLQNGTASTLKVGSGSANDLPYGDGTSFKTTGYQIEDVAGWDLQEASYVHGGGSLTLTLGTPTNDGVVLDMIAFQLTSASLPPTV